MTSYKDSGVEWIGEIPEDWDIDKIKYLSNLYGRIGWQGLTSEEYIDEGPFLVTGVDFCKGEIDWSSCVHISEKRWEQADKIQLKNNDLLMTKDGTVGKVAVVNNLDGKASLNSGVLLIDLDDKNSKKYLYWVLSSDVFWTWFNYKNSGNSTILHLYQKDFNEFIYAMPNLLEQNKIAEFLDKKCAEIDSISSKIEKQIELLKDYKKSLITETVTKGLDKNVPMKDSDIEWIDEIPEHWGTSKLKYNASAHTSGLSIDNLNEIGKYPVYDANKIVGYTNYKNIDKEYISIIKDGAGVGRVRILNKNTSILATMNAIIPCKYLINTYLYWILRIYDFNKYANGSTIPHIYFKDYAEDKITIPSIAEQKEISDFLDKKCSEIDSIISKKERQLDLMKEHRESLVYEYVTGKKRVGGGKYGN